LASVNALFDLEVFMKVLIWIACFFTTALIQTLFGMKLGGIPAAMFFGATFSIAKNFVARYVNRNNKTSKKYAETSKGLMKGFLWYGASIFYVILGTIFVSADPASFDFGTQIIIAILCIGLAIAGHLSIDKKIRLKYSEKNEAEPAETVEINEKICFCRKCGTNLEEDSIFCRKCGTEIKEEQQ
jgi:ribosomal protein L40E